MCNIYFFRYDPKTDTWTLVAPISSPRDAVGVSLLGDRLYAVGGYDGTHYLTEVECYDPQNNEWSKVRHFQIFSLCAYILISSTECHTLLYIFYILFKDC